MLGFLSSTEVQIIFLSIFTLKKSIHNHVTSEPIIQSEAAISQTFVSHVMMGNIAPVSERTSYLLISVTMVFIAKQVFQIFSQTGILVNPETFVKMESKKNVRLANLRVIIYQQNVQLGC